MADQNAPPGQARTCLERIEKSLLSHHLRNGLKGGFRIIRAFGEAHGKACIRIFKVGQIDIRKIMNLCEYALGLIARKIEDHGQAMPLFTKPGDELNDVRKKVIRGHEVDIMDPVHRDHIFYPGRQGLGAQRLSQSAAGDLVILAIGTFERAPGEKDGARASLPRDRWFFPEMGPHIGHPQSMIHAAESGTGAVLPGPVHPACPRAESTIFEEAEKIHKFL